jgi:pimeloyl-ACP methyl ester carboxylesterase
MKNFVWLILTLLILVAFASGYFLVSAHLRQSEDRTATAPKSGKFIQVGGSELFYQDIGPAGGPALVFVHATIAWGGTWMPTMQWLAGRGFRSIALDMPPMGYSSSSDLGYGRKVQGQLIAEVLRTLNLQNVTLVGHSFGARATLTGASLERKRIKNIVIASGAVGWTNLSGPEEVKTPTWIKTVFNLNFFRSLIGAIVTNPLLTRYGLELFMAPGRSVDDEILNIYQAPFFVERKSIWIGDWMSEFLTSEDVELANDTSHIFSRLDMKALVIWGDKDTTTPLWQGERLTKRLPSARMIVLKGVGHLPQIEAPNEFRSILYKFLKE